MAFAFAEAILPYHTSAQKQKGSRHTKRSYASRVMEAAGVCGSITICSDELQIPLAFLCLIQYTIGMYTKTLGKRCYFCGETAVKQRGKY